MGVVSNGMLCSGDELELTGDADGILILPPDSAARRRRSPTSTATSSSTSTSSRTAATRCRSSGSPARSRSSPGRRSAGPTIDAAEAGPPVADRLAVEVRDPDLCPRFVGRWVAGVTIGPSPTAVQARLLAAGMRPVSNVVDASNYVMLELGKPIHTFDAGGGPRRPDHRPAGGSRGADRDARSRRPDARPRTTLVIADPEGPIGIAGIMGGADSEIGPATTDVVIESADLRSGQHPPDRPALRAPLGGEPPVREGPGGPARPDRRRSLRPARRSSGPAGR